MNGFEGLEFVEVEVPAVIAAQVPGSASGMAELPPAIGAAFDTMMGFMGRARLTASGPPRVLYTTCPPGQFDFQVLVPVAAPPTADFQDATAIVGTVEGGKTYRFTHRGAYSGLANTYGRIGEFMKARGLMQTDADWMKYMPMWEEYLNDPETTPEADLLTHIYLPVR